MSFLSFLFSVQPLQAVHQPDFLALLAFHFAKELFMLINAERTILGAN